VTVTFSPIDVPAAAVEARVSPRALEASEAPPLGSRPPASLEVEAQLLREADHALKAGDASTSLRLLEEHARRFPNGALEPERSAERVLALCRAGRLADARREARAFLAGHPAGPLTSRVQASCGGGAE
jgi:hypothetical protein